MQTIAFRLETGDKNYGEVYLPDEFSGKLPVMIYCHGSGTNCSGKPMGFHATVRDKAIAEGMAYATFDCYAGQRTGGDYGKMTYARWAQNLIDVMDWLSAQDYIDPERIGALGISSGSTTALRAFEMGARLSYICSVATCITVHVGMWGQGGTAKCFVDNMDALLAGERIGFDKDFYIDGISNAPVHALLEEKITCPTLFLQGLKDNAFRISDARLAHDMMRRANLPAKYIAYPEGGHGLDEVAEETTADLFDWLSTIM